MSKPPVLQRHWRTICQQRQQRGTTMIEVMVAAWVLSAGLLGLAAMQTQALKTASGLATQQVMVQALGGFNEARLANPNHNIVDRRGPQNEEAQTLALYCNSLWSSFRVPDNVNTSQIRNSTTSDLNYIRTFLGQYTNCGTVAITEHADYWNQFGTYGSESATNGTECDYIVPRTRTVSCTLATGDVISLHNRVWAR